ALSIMNLSMLILASALSFPLATPLSAQTQQGQTQAASNAGHKQVTASSSAGQVRFASLGEFIQMRLEVIDSTGETVFESEFKPGNVIDWARTDKQGQRLGDGSYVCVVSVKDASGHLTRSSAMAIVLNQSLTLKRAEVPSLTSAQAQAAGIIAGE